MALAVNEGIGRDRFSASPGGRLVGCLRDGLRVLVVLEEAREYE